MTIKPVADLVADAERHIRTLSVDEAIALHGDPDTVFVDIRDVRELWREGAIPGAVHAPRGMLEFWVDPASPYHRDVFAQAGKTYVLFCAGGMRSALATKALREMGFGPVAHIGGGFGSWKEAGGPIEPRRPPPADH